MSVLHFAKPKTKFSMVKRSMHPKAHNWPLDANFGLRTRLPAPDKGSATRQPRTKPGAKAAAKGKAKAKPAAAPK